MALLPDIDPLGSNLDAINAERTQRWAAEDAAKQGLRGPATGYQTYSGAPKQRAQALDGVGELTNSINTLNALLQPQQAAPAETSFMDDINNRDKRIKDMAASLRPAFADGGKIDPEELMRQMAAKYKTGAPTQAAPQPVAQPTPQQQQQQPGSLLLGATGALRGRAAQIERATAGYSKGGKLKACAQGGKIQGPGTATSDSIPAQVRETGENILVSNNERIVSAEQDALLERIAQMLGFENVDMMFEQLTGKPVGPTMKAGKKAAATGKKPDPEALMQDIATRHGIDYQQPAAPTYVPPASPEKSQLQMVGEQSSADINGVNSVGAKLHHAAKGTLAAVPAAVVDIYNAARPKVSPLLTGEDYKAPVAATPASAPAPAASTQQQTPAVAPASAPTQAVVSPGDALLGRQQTHMENNNLRSFEDVGSGIVRQVGADGRKMITNVGTGDITGPRAGVVDDSASALIDQKNSTYNPAAQLERMQRSRMVGDLTDPTITDPRVKQQAAVALALMNSGRQGEAQANLQGAQADQAKALTAQTVQMEAMRGKLLDPNTPPEERARMIQALQAISGKGEETKIAEAQTFDPANPMVPIKVPYAVRGTQAYKVEDLAKGQGAPRRQVTQAELEATAKNRNMTVDQVKQALGIK